MFGIIKSFRKSSKLQKLEKKLYPPNVSPAKAVSNLLNSTQNEKLLNQFLNLCECDSEIIKLIEMYQLTRADFIEIYSQLLAGGLGLWLHGHYAALSTLAYVEPLQYYLERTRKGSDRLETLGVLRMYWDNKIPQGKLFSLI